MELCEAGAGVARLVVGRLGVGSAGGGAGGGGGERGDAREETRERGDDPPAPSLVGRVQCFRLG